MKNPVYTSPNRRYKPTLSQWKRVELETEFTPNTDIAFIKIDYIDFEESCVVLYDRNKVYFDCLSEIAYLKLVNNSNKIPKK